MTARARNAGPSWGFTFISRFDQIAPRPITDFLVKMGSLVAMIAMPAERRFSKRFLSEVMGRDVGWRDSWRHFNAFAGFLTERFRVANGVTPQFSPSDDSNDRMESLASRSQQALYGTFHFGMSDLMGFWLSEFDLSIRMIRYQVENSDDVEWLDSRFGDKVGFIWVNKPEEMLFSLKDAVADGHSVAMKCDRVAHASKTEVFKFLGKRRRFPFTIYHLAVLFDLPVVFAFGIQNEKEVIEVHSSRVYYPEGETRADKLERARAHFAETLSLLETLVNAQPYQWFNFVDGLPEV